jgi:hypothetical protein
VSQAQTVFVIALGAVALLIVGIGAFVVSSAWWSDRWYKRRGGTG